MSLIQEALRRAQPESLNLATLLLDRGRLGIAPEMAELFRDAALSELGIVVARGDHRGADRRHRPRPASDSA